MVFCKAMGLQLSRTNGSSPLWIKMVADVFHAGGIFPLTLLVFSMPVTISCRGSRYFHVLHLIRSGPGADLESIDCRILFTSSWVNRGSNTSHGCLFCLRSTGGGGGGIAVDTLCWSQFGSKISVHCFDGDLASQDWR